MLTLGIETSSDVCAVALLDGSVVLESSSIAGARAHATHLAPMIEDVIRAANRTPSKMDTVAVSVGPGSFTGLRIGLSTAKGLCMATGARLVAVPTPETLALSASNVAAERPIATVQKSRRGEVYVTLFRSDGELYAAIRDVAAVRIERVPAVIRDVIGDRHDIVLVGDGVPSVVAALEADGIDFSVANEGVSAVAVGRIGWAMAEDDRIADIAGIEPTYVSGFVASKPNAIFPASAE